MVVKNRTPESKVVAASIGGAVAEIIVYLLELLNKLDIPAGVELAITTLAVFFAGYFMPSKRRA